MLLPSCKSSGAWDHYRSIKTWCIYGMIAARFWILPWGGTGVIAWDHVKRRTRENQQAMRTLFFYGVSLIYAV